MTSIRAAAPLGQLPSFAEGATAEPARAAPPRVGIPLVSERSVRAGRKWSIGALVVYAATLVLLPGSFGGSLAFIPLAIVLTLVGWWRDRPSRPRRVAVGITLVILALSVPLLIYHLIWGDLNVAAGGTSATSGTPNAMSAKATAARA